MSQALTPNNATARAAPVIGTVTPSGAALASTVRSALSLRRLSPKEQMEALDRLQSQAERRVQLGMKLLDAAKAQASRRCDEVAAIKAEQDKLRADLQNDLVRSLRQYDQWVGKVEDSITSRLDQLEGRLNQMVSQNKQREQRLLDVLRRLEILLRQPAETAQRHLRDIIVPAVSHESPADAPGVTGPAIDSSAPDEPARADRELGAIYTDLINRLDACAADQDDLPAA